MRRYAMFLALSLVLAGPAAAESYPARQITVVVPFPAGGSVDLAARAVSQHMSAQWGEPIVVVNRSGASGNIGSEAVAHAPPDGYTLLVGSTALAISPAIYRKLGYDVRKDLAPVSQLVAAPNVLVVHPIIPPKSVRALVALAKAKPGFLNAASAGAGTSAHLSLVLFTSMAKVHIVHVPYKGAAPAMAAVASGEVDMGLLPISAVVPLIQAKRLRALGVTTRTRSAALPDVPTISEAGIKGYEAASWSGMLAPAGTPRAVIDKLNAGVVAALKDARVRATLSRSGAEIIGSSPDAFARHIETELEKWEKAARSAGIKRR